MKAVMDKSSRLAGALLDGFIGVKRGLKFDMWYQIKVSSTTDHKKTFFEAHPETEGKVIVHHAVEQQVQRRYPGLVSDSEMHSLNNLRGIPKELNSEVHLSKIRKEWNAFYRTNPNLQKNSCLQKQRK